MIATPQITIEFSPIQLAIAPSWIATGQTEIATTPIGIASVAHDSAGVPTEIA